MLLAVDVGNTQTHLGAFDGRRARPRLAPHHGAERDRRRAGGHDLGPAAARGARASIGSTGRSSRRSCRSSAPSGSSSAERTSGGACLLVGPDLKTGMPILVDNPHELGADRLVNAVAAHAKVEGRLRRGRLRHLDQLRRRLGRGRVPRRRDRPGRRDLDGGAHRARGEAPADRSLRPRGRDRQAHPAAIQAGFAYGFAGLGRRHRPAARRGSSASRRPSSPPAVSRARSPRTARRSTRSTTLLTLRGLQLIYERNT